MYNKSGIYCFTCQENDKKYVGQAINIKNRYNNHKWRYNQINDSGYNCAFHSALRKYGWENFNFEILEKCSIEELDNRERYWIEKLNSIAPNGYNILSGGQFYRIDIEKHTCPKCKEQKNIGATICQQCHKKEQEENSLLKIEDIDEELIFQILDTSLEAVAKSLGYASGNSLKKRLIKANIPTQKDNMFQRYFKNTGNKHPKQIQQEKQLEIKKQNLEKQKPRKVGQFDLDNNLINVYSSTKEAQRCGFSSGHISECCRGKRKKYRNYIWKYI